MPTFIRYRTTFYRQRRFVFSAVGGGPTPAQIFGTVAGTSTAVGVLKAQGKLVSAIDGTSTVTGDLSAIGTLKGLSTGSATVTGSLHAIGHIAGSASGSSTASGTLSQVAQNLIAGSSAGTSTAQGFLRAKVFISGTIVGSSTVILHSGEPEIGDSVPMLSAGIWRKNQPNTVLFVMADSSGAEVAGLGNTFTLQISKAGAAFQTGSGTKSEVGLGWYKYVSTAGEADTSGPVALVATGAGVIQQNLEYTVEDRVVSAVEFLYTLTNTSNSQPIPGADVSFSVNSNPANTVWTGVTDAFGVARDLNGNLPRLSPGAYYIFAYKPSFIFSNPDLETVS